jgi:2-polyprenyl-3-methyl-5-hydroxy-6-metoxy-1,4-benzoquinol methylase
MQVTQEKGRGQEAETAPGYLGAIGWADALVCPGHRTLFESMVAELAQYLKLPNEVVAAACASGETRVAEGWNTRSLHKGSEPNEIVEFYRTTQSYLFDLTNFNSEYPHTAALDALVDLARNRRLTHVLDFGAGIGSVGIFFARNGFDVSLADVSEPLQQYVKWRLTIRALKGTIINLNQEQLPVGVFDIVTAFDVLEHLPRPAETMRILARSIKLGGFIALNVGESAARLPQHISTYEDVLSTVAAVGFRRLKYIGQTEIFERVHRSALSARWHELWGKIWYGALYRPCINLLNLLGIKKLLRTLIKGPMGRQNR